ncbi:MAG: anti-sigma factor [Acidimicrobiia bacterium]|nr:anti-sigma factor [Acidimicrobiia bacterium]
MTCDQFQAAYLADGPTEAWDKHVATCDACRAAQPELAGLRTTLENPDLWQSPSPAVEDAVLAAITGTSSGSPDRAHEPSHRWPRSRHWVAAAASVAAVLALVVGITALRSDPADWSTELVASGAFGEATAVIDGWNTETGTRMELTVTGVENVAGTGFYEIWMTSPEGETVSAGTFRSSGDIATWSGVLREDFPRIWITFETDTDPAPSGEIVFDT